MWSLLQTIASLLREFSHFLGLFLELRNLLAFEQSFDFLPEPLDATVQKKHIVVALFVKFCCILDSHAFIEVVNNHYLVLLVFVQVEFGDGLVTFDVRTGIVESLLDMEILVFLRVSEIEQQKFCVKVHR